MPPTGHRTSVWPPIASACLRLPPLASADDGPTGAPGGTSRTGLGSTGLLTRTASFLHDAATAATRARQRGPRPSPRSGRAGEPSGCASGSRSRRLSRPARADTPPATSGRRRGEPGPLPSARSRGGRPAVRAVLRGAVVRPGAVRPRRGCAVRRRWPAESTPGPQPPSSRSCSALVILSRFRSVRTRRNSRSASTWTSRPDTAVHHCHTAVRPRARALARRIGAGPRAWAPLPDAPPLDESSCTP
ncbi:hypothetical protein OV320_0847 [Actinobacteria bacterium OV320]|nr:hypothetical protein OV320_0847 [Actinobacteria bacterium OV320]